MMKNKAVVASALAGVLSLGIMAANQAVAGDAAPEKCYGVAKAGKNGCQTANSSCAGTSKMDGQKDAWVHVPAGTCAKLVGGSLEPSA